MNDSPIGMLSYILQIFSTATNLEYRKLNDGGLFGRFVMFNVFF